MIKVGDRIRLSSMKGPHREGVVTAVTGSLLRVRWPLEEETTVIPAPGTLTVLAAGKAASRKAAKKCGFGRAPGRGEEEHSEQERDAQEAALRKRRWRGTPTYGTRGSWSRFGGVALVATQ